MDPSTTTGWHFVLFRSYFEGSPLKHRLCQFLVSNKFEEILDGHRKQKTFKSLTYLSHSFLSILTSSPSCSSLCLNEAPEHHECLPAPIFVLDEFSHQPFLSLVTSLTPPPASSQETKISSSSSILSPESICMIDAFYTFQSIWYFAGQNANVSIFAHHEHTKSLEMWIVNRSQVWQCPYAVFFSSLSVKSWHFRR